MNHQNHLIKRRCANLGVQGRRRLPNEIFNPLIQQSKVNSKELGREKNAGGKADQHGNIHTIILTLAMCHYSVPPNQLRISAHVSFLSVPHRPLLSLPPCFNPSTQRLILLNIQSKGQGGSNMINYRLSAAVSVHYVMQTSVQTHIHFLDAPLLIFPAVSFQFMPTSFLMLTARYNSAPL